jgi:ABC-type dipeptide/oligopeptide/nickel transport system ATPase component
MAHIRTKKLHNLVLKQLKNNNPLYANVPVPDGMFKYGILNLVGSLGSGKSTVLLQILRLYDTTKTFHKIFFYSPTMKNEEKAEYLPDNTEIFETFSLALYREHKLYIETEIKEYKIYLEYMEIYKKFLKRQHLTRDEELILSFNDFEPLHTVHKHMPSFVQCYDDMQSDKLLFSPSMKSEITSGFLNTRHRNTLCIFSCQSFKCSVPKQLKSQVSVYILFACKSIRYQRDIAEDLVGKVPVNTFLKLWDYATKEKYHFFTVDQMSDENNGMFRRDLDTILMIDDIAQESNKI